MPDVTRSDSQRSDTSLRPRVSFNRDVHVKRIVPREGARAAGGLSGDGNGHLKSTPIRKERRNRSRKELSEEAAQVLHQADKLYCISKPRGVSPEKFYTLPTRRKEKLNYPTLSLDRKRPRRNSLELGTPPKKPQRTFASAPPTQKTSVFDIFKKKTEPKKSNLRRSVSDASNVKSKRNYQQSDELKSNSDREDSYNSKNSNTISNNNKKQLSPIIEVTPREDYFSLVNGDGNKENNFNEENIDNQQSKSVTDTIKEYIDEIEQELYQENGNKSKKKNNYNDKDVEVVIIDVDKAEKISSKKSKLRNSSLGKKWKSFTSGSNKNKSNDKSKENSIKRKKPPAPTIPVESRPKSPVLLGSPPNSPGPRIKQTIEKLEKTDSPKMIHSSQKPPDKLPLTKGRTVDSMIRRLNNDQCSPPPKPNVMVVPNINVQHNNNQPFSYTRGLSPDKYVSDENLTRPIIYAQVVCNGDRSGTKQTIHTAYNKKQPNSDSDEGLGNEESSLIRKYRIEKNFTHFGDDLVNHTNGYHYQNGGESPILPKYRHTGGYSYEEKILDSSARGRADGMDSKRRESLTEQLDNDFDTKFNGRSDLSARRDLLESRINRRINDKSVNNNNNNSNNKFNNRSGSSSPKLTNSNKKYLVETTATPTHRYKSNYFSDNEPKSFDSQLSNYRSSPENKIETSHHRRYEERVLRTKNLYKSTPDIYHQTHQQQRTSQHNSYHDSLKRDRNQSNFTRKTDKERFGDSGIENDLIRRDSGEKKYYYGNESEDEGFASSLLIASERQHTDDGHKKSIKKEYDSDRAYSAEDDHYRQEFKSREYIPRERSIDDGSHFDPRIDKEFQKENATLKRTEKKPPKPEKKSGLEKVKQLFSRDSKKKKAAAQKHGMVREESLRARYTEYKGSVENLFSKKSHKPEESSMDYEYNTTRRRLSTPSPSPTRETNEKPDNTSHTNWFKSLDRLSRKKNKKEDKLEETTTTTATTTTKRSSPKNLRFFGDTDLESSDGGSRSTLKPRNGISYKDRTRSQSNRELHNIAENPEQLNKRSNHKSMTNISQSSRDLRGSRSNLKPPASPNHRSNKDISRIKDDRNRRRKYEISSVESSTEGDSSQQSQRSIVYLHAATVGDIPGPSFLRNGKRAASREELASNDSRGPQTQVKTLSRSFSVLAPWKPRHYHEGNDIDYSQQPKTKYEQKSSRSSRKESSSTLKKKAQDSKKYNSNSTLNRPKSKESLSKWSKEELSKTPSSTLYKKKERLPRENLRYTKERDEKKMSAKSMSVESLNRNERKPRDISRSISMPKDSEKSAGWFKKKTYRSEYTTHRL